jgi:twitching motility protein PilT
VLIPSVDHSRRYAAYEILIRTSALANLIQTGESVRINNEIQMNRGQGMILMDDSLMQLVQDNKVSKQEAYLKAIDKSKFV